MKARYALSQNVIEPRRPHCGHCRRPVHYGPEIAGGGGFAYIWFHGVDVGPECRLSPHKLRADQKVVDQFGGDWWEHVKRERGTV